MRKYSKAVIAICTIAIMSLNIMPVMAEIKTNDVKTQEENENIIPYAAASKHAYKSATKSKSTSYGTASIDYKFSGNYTYDLNSGEILSAYDAQLDGSTFNPPAGTDKTPNPMLWRYEITDVRLTSSVIDNGARAKYTISFNLNAVYYDGGLIVTDHKISIPVTDTLYAYAE